MQLRELASKRGISVQRMMVEDALKRRGNEGARSAVDVDETIGELVGVRKQIEAIGKNLNRFVVIAAPRGTAATAPAGYAAKPPAAVASQCDHSGLAAESHCNGRTSVHEEVEAIAGGLRSRAEGKRGWLPSSDPAE